MGCSSSKKQVNMIEPTLGSHDDNIMAKIKDLAQNKNLITESELALIQLTYTNIKEINHERRNVWLQTIHNDILAPIYFSQIENLPYSKSNPFVPSPEIQNMLLSKDYESLKKTKEELRYSLLHIFYYYYTSFNIDITKLQRFVLALSENYQDNPFHNFYHAFSVCQMIHSISERNRKFEKYLTEKETFALLISALGHDLNHPGVTNVFMINSRHPLAITYNDSSVLENHHAATLIKFLELSGCDIFTGSICDQTSMRKVFIQTILATDMAKHNFVIEKFSSAVRNFDIENKEHRQSFADIILHACDIGNPVLKFDLATIWSFKIIQEFNEQVWKEEKLGIPVSEFMRIGSDINKIKRNQIGFIDMFIYPLWLVLSPHLDSVEEFVASIENNKNSWENLDQLSID